MSCFEGSNQIQNGLVFSYDMANTKKSWKGAPATNLFTYSEEFSQIGWSQSFNVTNNTHIAPNGTLTADTLTGTPGGIANGTAIFKSSSITTGAVVTYSVYLKWGTQQYIAVGINYGTNDVYCIVDTSSSLIVFTSARNLGVYLNSSITLISNGFYRVSISGSITAVSTYFAGISFSNVSNPASINPIYTDAAKTVIAWGAQLETGSYATPYIPTTTAAASRSDTQSLLDLTGNNTVTSTSLTYNSDNTFSFNGTSDYLTTSVIGSLANFTIVVWIYPTSRTGVFPCAVSDAFSNNKVNYCIQGDSQWIGGTYQNSTWYYSPSITQTLNVWQQIVYSYDGTNQTIYKNGVSGGSTTTFSGAASGGLSGLRIGRRWDNADYIGGQIPQVRIYNRALSQTEVQQNFNALRGRYGI